MTSRYTCARCGQEIETGEFIAIIGEAPPGGLSTPIGRADTLIADIGKTYCRDCLTVVIEKEPD